MFSFLRYSCCVLLCLVLIQSSKAQTYNPSQDTANYPYWVEMMANPNQNFFQTQRAFEIYWKDRPVERGSGYKPFKRWEYTTQMVADKNGNILAPGTIEDIISSFKKNQGTNSVEEFERPGAGTAKCLKTGRWQELGPILMPKNNTGQPNGLGRVNALAFHPKDTNIFYAGAPAGGFWITKDGGKNWTPTTDTLETLGISSIAVHPSQPDTIYIGTGDRDASDSYGRGVFKTEDGGYSWKKLNSGMGNVAVGKLIMHPTNDAILLAAASNGVYRTTNSGATWSKILTGNFKDIEFCPSDPSIVYAVKASTAAFYRSTNTGASFTAIASIFPTSERRMAIATTPANADLVYVIVTKQSAFYGFYVSNDKGLTFKLMSSTPNIMDYSTNGSGTGGQAWYDLDIAVDPIKPEIVYVGGVNIFQSLDTGKTWTINAHWTGSGGAPKIHADQHVFEIQPNSNAIFVGNDGGVYYTKNDGKNWIEISDGLGIAQIYRLGQSATIANYVINGYQDNGTGMFKDGKWATIMGGDGMYCAIDPQNPTYSYSNLYYGDVRRYTNGTYSGKIAADGSNGINEAGGWVTPFVLRNSSPNTMYIGYKNLWRSTNVQAASAAAVSWTKISNNLAGNNTQNIIHIENNPANEDIMYLSKGGNAFLRTDDVNAASPTWTNLTTNLPNSANVVWIESDHKRENTLWISQSNRVYQSEDKGATWTNISAGLPNLPILSLVYDSSSKKRGIYAGTHMGVFYRDTTMSTWIWFNDLLPHNCRVTDLQIYYSPSGRSKSHIVAATYGRGNWKSPLYDEDELQPKAGFYVSDSIVCENQTIQLFDTSENIPTQWKWEITPSTHTFLQGTTDCDPNPFVNFTQSSTYTIKLIASNCGGSDSVTKTNIITVAPAAKAAACNGAAKNPSINSIGIFNLEINNTSFKSLGPLDEGSYVDWVCSKIFQLKSDTFYQTKITHGTAYDQYYKAYIDFNDNGSFTDAGELVMSGFGKSVLIDTIQIPSTVVLDKIIRMRVQSGYNPISNNPCDTLTYGQVEDYGVILSALKPTPKFTIGNTILCAGDYLKLIDTSEGKVYKWEWSVRNQITGNTITSLDTNPSNIALQDTGFYDITLYLNDSIAWITKDSAVYVKPRASQNISLKEGSNPTCALQRLTLSAQPKSHPFEKYLWHKNDVPIPGASDSFLTHNIVALIDSGAYRLVTEINGCFDSSNSIQLVVFPTPTSSLTLSETTACLKNNTIDFTAASSIVFGFITSVTHFGDGNSSTNTNSSHTYSTTGVFLPRLVSTSDKGCKDSVIKTLEIYPNPFGNIQFTDSIPCFNTNKFEVVSLSSGSNTPFSHQWIMGNADTIKTKDLNYSYSNIGQYVLKYVVQNSLGCTDTVFRTINIHPNPSTDFSINSTDFCLNTHNIDFTNATTISSGIFDQYWNLGDGNTSVSSNVMSKKYLSPKTYSVKLRTNSDKGCADSLQKPITISPSPKISIIQKSTSWCLNEHQLTFENNSSVAAGTINSHTWTFGNGDISTNKTPLSYKYPTYGVYNLTYLATSDQGCVADSQWTINILSSPKSDFSVTDICIGDSAVFQNLSTINVGNITSSEWNFGNGKQSTTSSPKHAYDQAGSYNVTLISISANGCSDTLSRPAATQVFALPKADFSYTIDASNGKNTKVRLMANGQNAVNQFWWVNGLPIGNDPYTEVNFNDTGAQKILFVVSSSFGCSDTLDTLIYVYPNNPFLLPSAFTPNGDILNGEFKPINFLVTKSYKMQIFNRNGSKIFESTSPEKGWKGFIYDKVAEEGVYVYLIEYIDKNGNKQIAKGNLTLIR